MPTPTTTESVATPPPDNTPKPSTDMLLDTTVYFAFILALALVIERVLEILKAIFDYADGRRGWYRHWTARTQRLKDKLERRIRAFIDPEAASGVLRRVSDHILNEQGAYQGTVLVLSADVVRATVVRGAAKVVGIGLGIAIACWQHIDLIRLYHELAHDGKASPEASLLNIVLSGVALGLGASPVHKIITAIERRREKRTAEKQEGATQ